MKNILILNAGSSSLKLQIIQFPEEIVIASAQAERIGLDDGIIKIESGNNTHKEIINIKDHEFAISHIADILVEELKAISGYDAICAVGHRVVHGGDKFNKSVEITSEVKEAIKELFPLAPLHNPANLKGIELAEKLFTNAKQYAIFDTSFHQTIPEKAYRYAIPKDIADENNIRLYGFHGTSHKYVFEKSKELLENYSKVITVHLGNGCSISAIKDGECIDHSLGFGPNSGLIMGTRCGDIDLAVIFYLMHKLNLSESEVNSILQKKSGMLGLTGYSDLRDIEEKAENGDLDCILALEMNAYKIKKYIGAYTAALNGVDAIVFTAGIGENSDYIRRLVCTDLDYLGVKLNTEINSVRSKEAREINTEDSRVKVLVVPTNEELEIGQQVFDLI